MSTVTGTFGRKAADRLAALLIDIACDAPERIETSTTRISARLIAEAREAMTDAGIDWRQLVRDEVARKAEARRRYYEARS
jgi:hypothetical protein